MANGRCLHGQGGVLQAQTMVNLQGNEAMDVEWQGKEKTRGRGGNPIHGLGKCWLPICNRLRTTPGGLEPEVWFRIVHLAQETPCGAPVAAYREQIVENRPRAKGAFENGNIGSLFRRAPPDQLLGAAPPCRGDPKPPRESKTPRVVKLLRKAVEWENSPGIRRMSKVRPRSHGKKVLPGQGDPDHGIA